MTLQNVRSLLWRGEDLGFGGGNTREVVLPTQVVAANRPTILTRAFTTSLDLTGLLNTFSQSGTYSTAGRNRILVNRNPRYFVTATIAFQSSGSNVTTVPVPIAPLQAFFLPGNTNSCVITPNSAWPVPQPLTGATTATVPIAQATNVLTIDLVIEQ